MINTFKFFIAVFVLGLSSCKHYVTRPFDYQDISTLIAGIDEGNKYLFTNRLAFSKLLAKAMKHVELRDYLQRISRENTDHIFNEIVFALHKGDIIDGCMTLQDYIRNEIDSEIRPFYQGDIIETLLVQDPMLTIKLPDIFYDIDWDVFDFSPLVYARTIDPIGNDERGPYYIGYHYSGYQDRLHQLRRPTKFSFVVKFSEDYILLDVGELTSFQGIPLSSLFPQYTPAVWSKLKDKILSQSFKSPDGSNLYYIKKRVMFDLYKAWEKMHYRNYVDSTDCKGRCLRDCYPIDSTYNVIESFTEDANLTEIFWDDTYILRENEDILIYYNAFVGGDEVKLIDKYYIGGFRNAEIINRKLKIDLNPKKQKYEHIGKVVVPYVSVVVLEQNFNKIELNHLVEKGWSTPKLRARDFEFFTIYRENLIFNYRVGIGKLNDISDEYCTLYKDLGNEYFGYCTPPVKRFGFGNIFEISFKY